MSTERSTKHGSSAPDPGGPVCPRGEDTVGLKGRRGFKNADVSMSRLSLSDRPKRTDHQADAVLDSWEEGLSSDGETETGEGGGGDGHEDTPSAPPPTPVSPRLFSSAERSSYVAERPDDGGDFARPAARPEKQTAVAGRLIAGALGIRNPKRSDEQKAYDRAMKEKEVKRRNREREAELKANAEAQRAKAAVWDE